MTQHAESLKRGLEAIRLLRSAPISTGELARTLGVSRDTVDRILAAIRQAGFGLTTTRRGRRALHSLPSR
jgi:DNA-binding IclR family transcriptional regulator